MKNVNKVVVLPHVLERHLHRCLLVARDVPFFCV